MKDLTSKIKSFWQKISKKEPSYERKSLKPGKDWVIILLVSQVIIILGAFGAFYFYKRVDSGELFVVSMDNVENEVKINLNLLKKTVDGINAREEELAKTKQGNVAPADPSR